MKAPRKRHTNQKKIEEISRSQFKEQICDHGWQSYDIDPDVGLDLRIEIVDEGVSTGLSFFVQLKGTPDSKKYFINEGLVSYQFDTDDLKYINQQSLTSYIVLWDTTLRTGWYVSINSVMNQLKIDSPGWSDQKTVKIHIPLTQVLIPEGLEKIRHELTIKYLPLYLEREPLELKTSLSFPKNDSGQEKYRELLQSIETGSPVIISSENIKIQEISDWWIRLMGEKSLNTLQIKLESSTPVDLPPVRIEFSSLGKGAVSIDYVQLRNIQHGTKQAILSNEHQHLPYKFFFRFNWPQRNGSFRVIADSTGLDVADGKKVIDLACLIASGGEMRIRNIMTNEVQTLNYQPDASIKPSDNVVEFFGLLARIQTISGIMIYIPPKASFTQFDLEKAKKVLSVVENGHYHSHIPIAEFLLPKKDIVTIATDYVSNEYYELVSVGHDRTAKLLSTSIPLGNVEQTIRGRCEISAETFDSWIESAKETDTFKVELHDVEIIEEYEMWKK